MSNVGNNKKDNNIEDMGRNIGTVRLTFFSIGATLAGGVFTLSGDMSAGGAHTAAVLTGWIVCGIGMFNLMMCFYQLNRLRPDLASGIFSYAREGFGEYLGFNSAWGYWISAMLANVAFSTLLFASLGYFFPVFGDGNNAISMICASALLWLTAIIIMRGVGQATTLNLIIVCAKAVPIIALVLAIVFAQGFRWEIFTENFWGDGSIPFFDQVKETIFTTVWVFIGVEGAVVISGRGTTTKKAGRAAMIAFLSLLALYMTISILSMGVLSSQELTELGNPPMAGVLEHVVGKWGGILVNIAVIISVSGAMYTYTMLCAESSFAPAALKAFPKVFSVENKKGAPMGALLISTVIIQIFLIIVIFNASTFQIVYYTSASMIMVPYFLSALFYLKLMIKGVGMSEDDSRKGLCWAYAIIGTIYGIWLMYASGLEYMLIMALLYGPGIFIYIWAKKQHKEKPFGKPVDVLFLIIIIIMFVASIILLSNGTIKPF